MADLGLDDGINRAVDNEKRRATSGPEPTPEDLDPERWAKLYRSSGSLATGQRSTSSAPEPTAEDLAPERWEQVYGASELERQRKDDLESANQSERVNIEKLAKVTETEDLRAKIGKPIIVPQQQEEEEAEEEQEKKEPENRDEPDEEDEDEEDNDDEDEDEDNEEDEEPESEEPESEDLAEDAGEGLGEGAAEGAGEIAGEAGAEVGAEAAAGAGAEAGAGLLAATSEFWVPALVVILGIILLLAFVIFIFGSLTSACNVTGAQTASKVASWVGIIPQDVCKQLSASQSGVAGGGQSGGGGGGASFGSDDATIRALLLQHKITVNKACIDPSVPFQQLSQTCLGGMLDSTVQTIISVAQACDAYTNPAGPPGNACGVQVTGGTELGHADTGTCTHSGGYKYDLGLTTALTNYIKTQFTPSGTRSDGAALYTDPSSGAIYALEGDHWDVSVCG